MRHLWLHSPLHFQSAAACGAPMRKAGPLPEHGIAERGMSTITPILNRVTCDACLHVLDWMIDLRLVEVVDRPRPERSRRRRCELQVITHRDAFPWAHSGGEHACPP